MHSKDFDNVRYLKETAEIRRNIPHKPGPSKEDIRAERQARAICWTILIVTPTLLFWMITGGLPGWLAFWRFL